MAEQRPTVAFRRLSVTDVIRAAILLMRNLIYIYKLICTFTRIAKKKNFVCILLYIYIFKIQIDVGDAVQYLKQTGKGIKEIG